VATPPASTMIPRISVLTLWDERVRIGVFRMGPASMYILAV